MTPQEKEIYFTHMQKRHREEAERVDAERSRIKMYRENLISDILRHIGGSWTEEKMSKLTTRSLERILFY